MELYHVITAFFALVAIVIIALAIIGHRIVKARKAGREEGRRIVDEINAENAARQGRKTPRVSFKPTGNAYRDFKRQKSRT